MKKILAVITVISSLICIYFFVIAMKQSHDYEKVSAEIKEFIYVQPAYRVSEKHEVRVYFPKYNKTSIVSINKSDWYNYKENKTRNLTFDFNLYDLRRYCKIEPLIDFMNYFFIFLITSLVLFAICLIIEIA